MTEETMRMSNDDAAAAASGCVFGDELGAVADLGMDLLEERTYTQALFDALEKAVLCASAEPGDQGWTRPEPRTDLLLEAVKTLEELGFIGKRDRFKLDDLFLSKEEEAELMEQRRKELCEYHDKQNAEIEKRKRDQEKDRNG